jgi:HK97 family phage major capsid protein
MTLEQMIAMMTEAQVESRMAAIHQELGREGADLSALQHEVELLEQRRAALQEERQAVETRAELMRRVAGGQTGTPVRSFRDPEQTPETRSYTAESPEYRRAWLKNIAVRDNVPLLGEMTTEERAAFTFLTSNTQAVVPTNILNRIVELVESQYPIYADATKESMTQGFSLVRHTAINQGNAAATDEAAANDDEQDTFSALTLTGVEIKKHIVISRKMQWQSIDAFEDWMVRHIAERIGVAKELHILSRLDNATYGIAAANKLTAVASTDAGLRSALALIRGGGARVVYANSDTIWNILAGIEDGSGKKAFIPSDMVDPTVQGRIYGAAVKEDINLADSVCYIGIPRLLLANNFEELFLNRDMDAKTFEAVVSGYSLFDAGLENPLAFVKITFAAAATGTGD